MTNLRRFRKMRKITMKELGDLVGVSESMICYYEKGTRAPSFEILLKLGEVLDCSVSDLVGDSHLSSENESFLSDPESIMLEAYRELNEHGQQKVYDYILDLLRGGYSKKDSAVELHA
ncbi:MAG: helix-turn-helix transcriptional regulator [Lachnospiraceae bacterium]|nr:helix-turn-helix transcriptional regulator [Lachnospiraceae bacterium]MBQ9029137.1 helix-turn-helix transcriptional regulator [Lachnospiraceae bacterium]